MSIRKRILPSGETRYLVDYRDAKGQRRAKQFKTKDDAKTYAIETGHDLLRGLHVAPGASPTVAQAGAAWLDRCQHDRWQVPP